ncbi:GPW/gp25 family protein [Xanthobacter sp. 126]|uniref:GPW/gp25 family protein n=1 Tax=Xanthobacter sp. 126 TaxID=1131814 RepID=UPI00045EC2AD|nr:GPW/gp25 family protein [Xanthobacter sp. 126]
MVVRTQRTGTDRLTGRLLRGRAHAEQSVRDILATRTGTRWMRLDYGSDLAALRGENLTAENVLRAYAEMVEAIHSQEPAVRVAKISPAKLDGRAGVIGFDLYLRFYPYGHLGDYSVVEDMDLRVPVTALTRGTGAVA